jgi:electron transfer flavoprotein alpha/beta subunit
VKIALGMVVDRGVLVSDPALLDSDPFGVAHILAKAVSWSESATAVDVNPSRRLG